MALGMGLPVWFVNIGLFQKKNRVGDVEDMEFPRVLRNSKWNFQGLIKNNMELPGVIKKKSCEISRGLEFRP